MPTTDNIRPAEAILSAAGTGPHPALDLRAYTHWPKFLYLIHFAQRRHHAQHYLGSSYNLYERLAAHARGHGARLTKALWEDDQEWTLAALFIPKPTSARSIFELEKQAKQRHQASAYCPICCKSDQLNIAPAGTMQYPIPFHVSASELRKESPNV